MYSVPKVFIPATPIIPNNNKRVEALNQADVSLFSYFSMINSVRKDTKTNIPQYLWSYERFRNRSDVEENIYN